MIKNISCRNVHDALALGMDGLDGTLKFLSKTVEQEPL